MTQGKLSLWQQHWPWSAHNTARKTIAQLVVRHEWEALGHYYGATRIVNSNAFAAFTDDFIKEHIEHMMQFHDLEDASTFLQVLLKYPHHRDLCINTITDGFAAEFADDLFESATDFVAVLEDMPTSLKADKGATLAGQIARALYDRHASFQGIWGTAEFEDLGKLWQRLAQFAPETIAEIFREKTHTDWFGFDIDDAVKALEIAHEGRILRSIPPQDIDTLINFCTDNGMAHALHSVLWFKAARDGAKEDNIKPFKSRGLDREQFTLVPVPINNDDNLCVLFRHRAENPLEAAVTDGLESAFGDNDAPYKTVGNISMPGLLDRLFVRNDFMCAVEVTDRDPDILARITSTFERHASGEIGTPQTRAVAQRVLPVIEAWCNEHGGTIPTPTPEDL